MKEKILEILKSEKNWSIDEFYNYFNIDIDSLYNIFLSILEDEVETLDFDFDVNRYKYLYRIFKYSNNLDDIELLNKAIIKLKKLQTKFRHRLNKAIKSGNEKANHYNVIYKLLNIIDVTILRLEFNLEKTEVIKDEEVRNYKFLCGLIYKVKNYDYVYEIFKTSNDLMYTKNKEGKLLFYEIVDKYMKTVETSKVDNHYEIIYYEKIIKIFLDSSKFKLDKTTRENLVNKFLLNIDRLRKSKISKSELEKITFFFGEIIKCLKGQNVIIDLDDLNFKYNINPEFDSFAIEEAENIQMIDNVSYLDLRDKNTFTIDSPGTVIHDDAISVEKLSPNEYLLNIYISDVDNFIKFNSFLDKLAFERGEAIYFKHRQYLMFPLEAVQKMSLDSNKDRCVLAYSFIFDQNMNLVKFDVNRAIINLKANLSYFDVNDILNKAKDKELFKILKILIEMLSIMNNIDVNLSLNNNQIELSHFIIMMNREIANFFSYHKDIPFPYHVNLSKNNDNVIKVLKQNLYDNADLESILNCLENIYIHSFYSTENLEHSGLNLKSYCNAGNPIRQYISLITERLVKQHIIDKKEDILINLNDMNRICEYINNRQLLNFEYKQEYIKLKVK